ncbi:MAG: aminotransferase class V-fold PLP-dependent enzyme [Myxococcota bacterium]
MRLRGPRILLIGGTYRALCLLEHLLERGERVAAFIGQEGGEERDFCPEILEICDRMQVPARSGRKLGEELVRWLEDRIRPDLAVAVGVSAEIPLAIGGNCRLGLLEALDHFQSGVSPGVTLRQRGQVVYERALEPPDRATDAGDAFLETVDALLAAVDHYLDGLGHSGAATAIAVPFSRSPASSEVARELGERPDPGPETDRIEREAAFMLGAERVIALRSVGEAFESLPVLLGLRAGDEILCSPLAASSALRAFARAGVRTVYVDVDPERGTLDPQRVEEAVGPRTRALLISHSFGQPAPLEELYPLAERHGLEVLEDGAGALGARFDQSPLGRAPCVCVFDLPVASLPGGRPALVTLPGALAALFSPEGAVSRAGEGASRRARVVLEGWEERLSQRRAHASAYSAELSPYDAFRVPITPDGALPVYAQYLLRLTRFARTSAEDLSKLLLDSGIETRRIAVPLAERDLARLPAAESICASGLLLPVELDRGVEQRERVLEAIFDYAIG